MREIVAAFEEETGKQVELVLQEQNELPQKMMATLEAGHPPDFAFGLVVSEHIADWAFHDQLVDLFDAIGHFSDLFDPTTLNQATLLNAQTGQKALYGLPVGRSSNHVHIWKEPARARRLHARRHPARMGCLLVVLVR
ncbi:MAG: extracellular solute-binding protein [Geminicoccaceae bacterium]